MFIANDWLKFGHRKKWLDAKKKPRYLKNRSDFLNKTLSRSTWFILGLRASSNFKFTWKLCDSWSSHFWMMRNRKLISVSCGMETFRGQWHLVDTIFQNGRLFMDIPKGWLFVDTFGDISWTILVRLSKHCSVPG